MKDSGKRYIGLDVYKHYLIALGVDEDLNVVLPARRVELSHLESWLKKSLSRQDDVVLEMTTNTWQLYDELCAYAGGQSAAQFVRQHLDAMALGHELTSIAWGCKKPIPLPPSTNKVSDVPNTK